MLHGYLSWWHVAVAEVSGSERVAAAAAAIDQQLAKARQY